VELYGYCVFDHGHIPNLKGSICEITNITEVVRCSDIVEYRCDVRHITKWMEKTSRIYLNLNEDKILKYSRSPLYKALTKELK